MSEGEPVNPFRFRRVPQDVKPDSEQFKEDTSRMDEILDNLTQGILEPESVTVSAFTPLAYPRLDRPITEDDFLLLTEIIKLRVDLAELATQRVVNANPNSANPQNHRG